MNYLGSSRQLVANSIASMIAAVEIYNKPSFDYKTESFVILLINSWELLFKSILSKNKERIYYPKERNKPYKTFSLRDAKSEAKKYFPKDIKYLPVSNNIESLIDYRNNAVHFYNERDFEVLIFGLAQTSLINYRDLLISIFRKDIADSINICLLPLSFSSIPDQISFIQKGINRKNANPFVNEYLKLIFKRTDEIEKSGNDTARYLCVFEATLISSKKIETADITAKISQDEHSAEYIFIKSTDPNITHPNTQKDILRKIGSEIKGVKFTSYVLQALIWDKNYKDQPRLCWKNNITERVFYSNDIVQTIKSLSANEIEQAKERYKNRKK